MKYRLSNQDTEYLQLGKVQCLLTFFEADQITYAEFDYS